MDKQKRIDWLKDRISSMEKCRDEIPFGLSEDESMELYAYKDSLASLTAVPFGWQIAGNIFPTLEEALKPGYIGTPEPIYDEPPVPEIKLPDQRRDYGKWESVDIEWRGMCDGWNSCLAEIKRLNGWGELYEIYG